MKKILLMALLAVSLVGHAGLPAVSEKVLKNFSLAFPAATEVSWSAQAEEVSVSFIQGHCRCKAWYDAEGTLLKVIRYYRDAELLPLWILAQLQQQYNTMQLHGVVEISDAGGTTYRVVLKDQKHWCEIFILSNGLISQKKTYNQG